MKFLAKILIPVLFVFFSSFLTAKAAEEELKAKAEVMLQQMKTGMEAKDINKVLSQSSKEFTAAYAGPNYEQVKKQLTDLFQQYDAISYTYNILSVKSVGKLILVITDQEIKGRKANSPNSEIATIQKNTSGDILWEENGQLKIISNVNVKKDSLKWVEGQTYNNKNVGISFQAPQNWIIVPAAFPTLLETVYMIAPDGKSVAMYGYLELPYSLSVKQAVDGDDQITRKLAGNTYKEFYAKAFEFKGYDAYDQMAKFIIPQDDRDRQRRRVYFNAGGLLHVFNMDVIPSANWNQWEKDYQGILDSFAFAKEKEKNALKAVHKEVASGTVQGNIYSNEKAGCQIAAPKGWKMQSSNIGGGALFSVNIQPQSGDSLVRFIAWPVPDGISLSAITDQQNKGVEQLASNVTTDPTTTIKVGNIEGIVSKQQFTLDGVKTFKRKAVFFIAKKTLFAVICDALPPAEYPVLEPRFDEIIQSFTIN